MVSEQLRRVLFYPTGPGELTAASVCVCECVSQVLCVCVPGVSIASSPGALLGHITYSVQ